MRPTCRSDCPDGDCAGCAFPPQSIPRCVPAERCPQRDRCARAATADDLDGPVVDYSQAMAGGPFCVGFVDIRGLRLIPVGDRLEALAW